MGGAGLNLYLIDLNPDLVEEWKRSFSGLPNVHIDCRNILDVAQNAIVSPANSYGFMDGGID